MKTRQTLKEDIKRKLNRKETIDRITAVINLAGLPNSGKTTLVDRLLRRPISKENNCSTDICEPTIAINVEDPILVHAVANLNWKEIGHGKALYGPLMDESSKRSTEKPLSLHPVSKRKINPSNPSASQYEQMDSAHQMNIEGTTTQTPSDYSNDMEEMSLDTSIMEIVKHYNIENIHDFATKGSLYIRDVGGQIEFKHGLSLLAFGPSIFLFVFNACIGIDQAQELIYRPKKEEKTIAVGSKVSTKTALLQCLSSVKALTYTEEYGNDESCQPVVFIVGTHMDLISRIEKIKEQLDFLSQTDTNLIQQLETIQKQLDEIKILTTEIKDIKDDLKCKVESGSVDGEDIQLIKKKLDHAIPSTCTINKNLKEIIEEHKFKNTVKYAEDLKPMFEVNNKSGTDEGIENLRRVIYDLVSKPGNHFNVKYPVKKLLFALEFLKEKESVLKFQDCEEIAQKFQITDIPDVLNFFHSKVGILLWFDIESLKRWVIKEPQVLFHQITKVIVKTYIPNNFKNEDAKEKAQKCGIFEENTLENILTDKDCNLEWNELLDYFIHLRMIAPMNDIKDKASEAHQCKKIKKYFIPCVLHNESLDSSLCEEDVNISPIMFTFECGSVPDGLFSVLIVCLMEGIENHKISFQLQYERIYKDKINFSAIMDDNEEIISLKFYPSFLEVNLYPMESNLEEPDSVAKSCHVIRTTIYSGIEKAIECLHYNKEVVKPHISFICQYCNMLHPVKEINGKLKLVCTIKEEKMDLQKKQLYWFKSGKSSTDVNELLFHKVGSKWFKFLPYYTESKTVSRKLYSLWVYSSLA